MYNSSEYVLGKYMLIVKSTQYIEQSKQTLFKGTYPVGQVGPHVKL